MKMKLQYCACSVIFLLALSEISAKPHGREPYETPEPIRRVKRDFLKGVFQSVHNTAHQLGDKIKQGVSNTPVLGDAVKSASNIAHNAFQAVGGALGKKPDHHHHHHHEHYPPGHHYQPNHNPPGSIPTNHPYPFQPPDNANDSNGSRTTVNPEFVFGDPHQFDIRDDEIRK